MRNARLGRDARILTMNVGPQQNVKDLIASVPRTGEPLDLVVFPESVLGLPLGATSIEGPDVAALGSLARERHAYVTAGLFLAQDDHVSISSVLFDREGRVAGIYDKQYPYWSDLDAVPAPTPGIEQATIWETDFARIGPLICFDVNFPHVWQGLADAGAEMVVWQSAYAGGRILQSYATIHHYYVLSCTQVGTSRMFDPIGNEVFSIGCHNDPLREFNVDLNTALFHHNFNREPLSRLLADHAGEVAVQTDMKEEEWTVVASRVGHQVDVHALAGEYGLEELRAYLHRSGSAMDEKRATGRRP